MIFYYQSSTVTTPAELASLQTEATVRAAGLKISQQKSTSGPIPMVDIAM